MYGYLHMFSNLMKDNSHGDIHKKMNWMYQYIFGCKFDYIHPFLYIIKSIIDPCH